MTPARSISQRIRTWALVGIAGLFVVLTYLASRPLRLELAVMGLTLALVTSVVHRRTPRIEAWRFIAGPLVFLVAVLATEAIGGVRGERAGLIRQGAALGLKGVALAWSAVAIARLGAGGWVAAAWRAVPPALLAYVLLVVNASSTAVTLCLAVVALWGIPAGWLRELPSTRAGKLQAVMLVMLAPMAFLFSAGIHIGEGDRTMIGGQDTAGLIGSLQSLLLLFWLTLPLRLVLRGFKYLMLGLSIRMRLVLTYFLSTVVPGLLVVVLVGVAVFAGIGTLRARVASNLVSHDLEALAARMDETRLCPSALLENLAAGFYAHARIDTTRTTEADSVIVPAEIAVLADSLLPRELGPLEIVGPGVSMMAVKPDTWIRLAQRGSWALPDTLVFGPEMLSISSQGTAIIAVNGGRAAFFAARPLQRPGIVRVLARPLDEDVVEGYKRIVGADLIISPTATMTMAPEGSDVRLTHDERRDSVAPISTRPLGQGQGLFSRQLRHGICELQATRDTSDVGRMRGVVVVRTSLAGLAASLFTTQGINVVVVVVVGVLAGLIVIAAVFTTVIGFSLNGTIATSMLALKRGAERLRQGDLDARIETHARGEMGRLAASFNQLARDLKDLVSQVAEKERLDRELQIAREIQVNLLPGALPQVNGLELAAISRPAREVAGDYYDALMVEPGRLVLVVADVSGKGVAAAMLMSNLQSALHVLLSQNLRLDTIVTRLNTLVCRNSPAEMFITLFIGMIDTRTFRLDYVNAGHDEPLIIRGDGTLRLGACGLLLGMFPEAAYTVGSVELRGGDLLALYSDGLTESMSSTEEEFGVERLEHALRAAAGRTARDVLSTVLEEVRSHTVADELPSDDLTFLVASVIEIPPAG
ncbi:MAG: PP2C family protein-serine/threonine phosphatase [Candidatus Eisenbacteria bacterium]|jgi:serine phosphatase RsbU (regulator of sigma subunit)|nr:PP2C family protein-serine/threonine phosphatase [Candidatus Eisenbacteria bacterium]